MTEYPRRQFDAAAYEQRVRSDTRRGDCFICAIVAGNLDDHLVIFRDDLCVAFLAKHPTLVGYSLLAPLSHHTDVVGDFSQDEYVELRGGSIASVTPSPTPRRSVEAR